MEALIYQITTAVSWSMLHSLWQGAILYILLCLAMMVFPKMHARGKHNLAFLFQMVLTAGFACSFMYYYQVPFEQTDSLPINVENMAKHIGYIPENHFQLESLFPYLFTIYSIGILLQTAILFNSFLKLRRLKYKSLHGSPLEWQAKFDHAKAILNIKGYVPLFLSERISVPITIGFFKPVVLFPFAYANMMELEQVESILLHELAHIKRKDYLLNLIKVTIETILFFNPFVWALSKIMEREREHACDDMVLEHVEKPITYAHALVELETLRQGNSHPLSMAATGRNSLFKRIKRITKMETNYISVKQQLIALLISSVVLVTVAWLVPNNEAKAEESENVQLLEIPKALAALPPLAAQQDTTKKKKHSRSVITSLSQQDSTKLPAEVQAHLDALHAESASVNEYFKSPEWKQQMESIQSQSKSINEYFNSPKWKQKIEDLNANVKKQFDSPEWKANVKKMAESGADMAKYYESKEWKDMLKSIEAQSKEIEQYFESPEWHEKIAKLEKDASKVDEYFNSPAWKDKIKKIEDHGKEIEKYFDSPEWKAKVKAEEEFRSSSEFKEIDRIYKEDLDALRKEKNPGKN